MQSIRLSPFEQHPRHDVSVEPVNDGTSGQWGGPHHVKAFACVYLHRRYEKAETLVCARMDPFWALHGGGAQVHRLECSRTEANLQSAQWGASLNEQYRRLGEQLHGLEELEV